MGAVTYHATDIPLFAKLLYLGVSFLLFFYVVIKPKAAPFVFSWAIAINIFPFVFSPHYDADVARVASIPLSYLPMIASATALIFVNGLRFRTKDRAWLGLAILFIAYTFITTFLLHDFSAKSLVYFLGWPFNFFLFLTATSYFSKLKSAEVANKVILKLVVILLLGCLVGLFRYFTSITFDANFMPFMNRNTTATIIVMVSPLIFYLHFISYINTRILIVIWLLFFVTFLFMLTRTGMLAFILATSFYAFSVSKRGVLIGSIVLVGIVGVYLSGFADAMFDRFASMSTTLSDFQSGRLGADDQDFRRITLFNSAISIIKENFFFGTGVGVENYLNELKRVEPNLPTHYGKSHNFYLSYFAELGLIGFSLLLFLLVGIYRKIRSILAMKISFITMAIVMLVSEYILLPELWFFFGMLAGLSAMLAKNKQAYKRLRKQSIKLPFQ